MVHPGLRDEGPPADPVHVLEILGVDPAFVEPFATRPLPVHGNVPAVNPQYAPGGQFPDGTVVDRDRFGEP